MKKKRIECLVVLLLFFCMGQTFAQLCGDVNSTGKVDITDALVISQYSAGMNPLNFNSAVANVNGDSSININDALTVARFSAGMIAQLSCTNATPTPTRTPTAQCTPAPTPNPVNVAAQGSPFTGSHQVVVETDPGLPGVTIFRPKDLGGSNKYPIVSWGQGGCSLNGTTNPEFQGEIASHGYLVLSDGSPNGSGSRSMGSDYRALGKPLLDAIGWAIAENNKPCSRFYQSLDTSKTAVFGWSCGGLMAIGASGDSRVTTVILDSSGMINTDTSIYQSIHTPMLYVLGGSSDMAYQNGMNDYANINNVPIVVASTNVGHGGTYTQDNGGSFAKVNIAWLDWWLKGDTGTTGKGMFTGTGCGLCKDTAWTIQSKGL